MLVFGFSCLFPSSSREGRGIGFAHWLVGDY